MSEKMCNECKRCDGDLCTYFDNYSDRESTIACILFEPKNPTIFDRITASPEVLAEKTVYMDYNYDKQMCGFTSPFIDEIFLIEEQPGKCHEEKYFCARNKAIAATVAKLKEVCVEQNAVDDTQPGLCSNDHTQKEVAE